MNRWQKATLFIGLTLIILGLGMLLGESRIPSKTYYKLTSPVYYSPQSEYPIKPFELLIVVNKEREKKGLPVLKESNILDYVAYHRALDIKNNRDFSHQATISGLTYTKLTDKLGYRYKRVAENLAIGFSNGEQVVKEWLLSEKHRDILLNPDYTEIGIATLKTEFDPAVMPVVTVAIFGAPL